MFGFIFILLLVNGYEALIEPSTDYKKYSIMLQQLAIPIEPSMFVYDVNLDCTSDCNDKIIYSCSQFQQYVNYLDEIIKLKTLAKDQAQIHNNYYSSLYQTQNNKYKFEETITKQSKNVELAIQFLVYLNIIILVIGIFITVCAHTLLEYDEYRNLRLLLLVIGFLIFLCFGATYIISLNYADENKDIEYLKNISRSLEL